MRGWLEMGQPSMAWRVASLCQMVRNTPSGSTAQSSVDGGVEVGGDGVGGGCVGMDVGVGVGGEVVIGGSVEGAEGSGLDVGSVVAATVGSVVAATVGVISLVGGADGVGKPQPRATSVTTRATTTLGTFRFNRLIFPL